MLISLHIPKTAGSAWRLHIEANNARRASFTSPLERDRDEPAMQALRAIEAGEDGRARTILDRAGTGIIHGHEVRDLLPLFPDAGLLAWLRDPVDRVVSEYRHLRVRPPAGKIQERVHSGEMSLMEFIPFAEKFYRDIHRMAWERPGPYAFFLQEEIDAAMHLVRTHLGWPGDLPRRNVTPQGIKTEDASLNEAERAEARTLLAPEYEIYELWRERWQDGSAAGAVIEVLETAPPPQTAGRLRTLKRRVGVHTERLGRMFGKDWR